jgi:hypothetical protein
MCRNFCPSNFSHKLSIWIFSIDLPSGIYSRHFRHWHTGHVNLPSSAKFQSLAQRIFDQCTFLGRNRKAKKQKGVPSCTEGLPLSTAPEWICPTEDNTSPNCSTLERAWKSLSARHESHIIKPSLIYEQWLANHLFTDWLSIHLAWLALQWPSILSVIPRRRRWPSTIVRCK